MIFKATVDIDVAWSLTNSKTLKGDLLKAKTQAMVYYLEEMIQEHFNYPSPNTKYNYKPNKITYEIWKRKTNPMALYQLVLSGRLRNAVLNGRVDSTDGSIRFNLPEYGLYQLKAGRNFLDPNFSDQLILQDRIRRALFFIRSNRAKSVAARSNRRI